MRFDKTTNAKNSCLRQFNTDGNGFVYLKEELGLTSNSYKIRGVVSFFESLKNLPSNIQVLSAGNLALATAHECRRLGLSCTAIVPEEISKIKSETLLGLGAQLDKRPFAKIWDLVLDHRLRDSIEFLHPLNSKLVHGYGAIAYEINEKLPSCDGIVIPYGLGGLALGITRRLKAVGSKIPVFICEITDFDPFNRAKRSSSYSKGPKLQSFIEAMGAPEVITDVFHEINPHVEEVITVDEGDVVESIRTLHTQCGIRAEGAAGAAIAASLKLSRQGRKNLVAVLTGGNITDEIFSRIIHE